MTDKTLTAMTDVTPADVTTGDAGKTADQQSDLTLNIRRVVRVRTQIKGGWGEDTCSWTCKR